jgi:hypothetical protein
MLRKKATRCQGRCRGRGATRCDEIRQQNANEEGNHMQKKRASRCRGRGQTDEEKEGKCREGGQHLERQDIVELHVKKSLLTNARGK